MDCLFCKIIDGSIATNIVYQDDQVIAFKDINPQAPIHILIIPRQHITTLNDLNDNHKNLLGHMMLTASKLAQNLTIADTGYRVVMNCNREGGQSVYHIHLHLLGKRQMQWPPG